MYGKSLYYNSSHKRKIKERKLPHKATSKNHITKKQATKRRKKKIKITIN